MPRPNYEEFVANLVKPLVAFPDDVRVATLSEEKDELELLLSRLAQEMVKELK